MGRMSSRFAMITLGCAKNLVDSEVMASSLLHEGMRQVKDGRKAELMIINTCAFIDAAKQEAINTIIEQVRARDRGEAPEEQKIVVTGCLSQRYAKQLVKSLPEVDAFVGVDEVGRMGKIAQEIMAGGEKKIYSTKVSRIVPDFGERRFRYTPRHTAYVKIAEGCNHACAYCAIPRIRGRHRSRPQRNILREVETLVREGVREINLIAQDTTCYGLDRAESGETLSSLLRAMNEIRGDFRVRVLYTHPAHWTKELIDTFAECEKVAKYVDIPLQHIAEHILHEQRRRTSAEDIKALLRQLRETVPGIGLRTTFISGLPGETEADHEELCQFVREFQFERAGVVPYSREEGTLAAKMPNQVHPATKKRRANELNMILAQIADEVGRRCVGKRMRVLVDAPGIGRGEWDAPDVDGAVHVDPKLPVGEYATVEIVDSIAYELFAEGAAAEDE